MGQNFSSVHLVPSLSRALDTVGASKADPLAFHLRFRPILDHSVYFREERYLLMEVLCGLTVKYRRRFRATASVPPTMRRTIWIAIYEAGMLRGRGLGHTPSCHVGFLSLQGLRVCKAPPLRLYASMLRLRFDRFRRLV